MSQPEYVDNNGVGFNIHRGQDGTWQVWSWHNKLSGWTWRGTLPSHGAAHSFMATIGSFEEEKPMSNMSVKVLSLTVTNSTVYPIGDSPWLLGKWSVYYWLKMEIEALGGIGQGNSPALTTYVMAETVHEAIERAEYYSKYIQTFIDGNGPAAGLAMFREIVETIPEMEEERLNAKPDQATD